MQNQIPTFFIGHGSPINAIEANKSTLSWRKLAHSFPKPKAIVVVSAHWQTQGTSITAMEFPKTIHDFGGFPKKLFDVQYSAKGDPELAEIIATYLGLSLNFDWGLDHGTWSVLAQMYPKAEIPVLQISLDIKKTPQEHFELGQRLAYLREEGVLILGSGNIVHNLYKIGSSGNENLALEFDSLITMALQSRDYYKIINYQQFAPSVNFAVPTPEHFLPMLYVIGASSLGDKVEIFNQEIFMNCISMTSVRFG